MKLTEKVAIVTGAGSGIGRTIAQLFAREGARVTVVDRDQYAGNDTIESIRATGGDALSFHGDVAKSGDVRTAVAATVKAFGRLDVLVNNAAVQVLAKLVETSEEGWDLVHNVNLKGVFLGCKFAIPAMVRTGGGSIVNIGSVLGLVGDPDLAAYCAAKGGVISLTKVAAVTYGPQGVRVNCICPGDVDTPLAQSYFAKDLDPDRLRNEVYSKYALRRIATTDEVANAALFLASDASSFITGSTLMVDGGLTSKCY